jgi:AcrR family transcriptional regulator
MSRRRESIETTRDRITAAAFELHATVGPARTTIGAIAERAGVQRHTVYAHFPDIDTLYRACTEHGIRSTAMPDPATWSTEGPAGVRLRDGLRRLYGWYRVNERMLANVLADADPKAPPPADPDAFDVRMEAIRLALAALVSRPAASGRADASLRLAIAFPTWRILTAGTLGDEAASELMASLVETSTED